MSSSFSILLLPFVPGKTGGAIRATPAWAGAFVVLTLLFVILEVVSHDVHVRWTIDALPPSVTPGQADDIRTSLARDLPRTLALLPLRIFIPWLLKALLLLLLVRALGGNYPVRLAHTVALVVGAGGIEVAEALVLHICSVSALWTRETITAPP